MNDDYLWDGSGTPDPDVARLEQQLSSLRYDAPLAAAHSVRSTNVRRYVAFAAAAAILLAAGIGYLLRASGNNDAHVLVSPADDLGDSVPNIPPPPAVAASWGVQSLSGAPTCNNDPVTATTRLPIGGWLETDSDSSVAIQVADIGTVVLDPNGRVRLVGSKKSEHRLELLRGKITATINAPPRLFFVETPAGTAVDLGCEYTLEVSPRGVAVLAVSFGYVSIEHDKATTLVPAGYISESRPGQGPCPPYAATAPESLRAAVREYAFGTRRDAALTRILKSAEGRDAVTLWHLMARATPVQCKRVVKRLVEVTGLAAPAAGCDPAAANKWRALLEDVWMDRAFDIEPDDAPDIDDTPRVWEGAPPRQGPKKKRPSEN